MNGFMEILLLLKTSEPLSCTVQASSNHNSEFTAMLCRFSNEVGDELLSLSSLLSWNKNSCMIQWMEKNNLLRLICDDAYSGEVLSFVALMQNRRQEKLAGMLAGQGRA